MNESIISPHHLILIPGHIITTQFMYFLLGLPQFNPRVLFVTCGTAFLSMSSSYQFPAFRHVLLNLRLLYSLCLHYLYYIQRKIFSESVVLCHNAPDWSEYYGRAVCKKHGNHGTGDARGAKRHAAGRPAINREFEYEYEYSLGAGWPSA